MDLQAAIWDTVISIEPDGTIVGRSPGPRESDGEFWYEALQREKADPARRYEIARRHLPLPAAWREMAIALRTMIRQARKSEAPFEHHLRDLHHLAAVWSFSDPAPSGRAGSGYGVIEMTPYAKLEALDLSWGLIGCDALSLLNASDRRLMRQAWGDPARHTTAHELYRAMFDDQARRVAADRERRQREPHARFAAEIDDILAEEVGATPTVKPAEPRRGLLRWLFR